MDDSNDAQQQQNIAYCVKCKEKREMKDTEEVEIERKGGTKGRALKGICTVCGTKMMRFLPSK